MLVRERPTTRTCTVDGCDRTHQARGYCLRHYLRWYYYGPSLTPTPRPTAAERFWARVHGGNVDQCWIWQGSFSAHGYGRFHAHGRDLFAHRWAYEHLVAPIPDGLELDHLCHTNACVNPWHLDPVTGAVNKARQQIAVSRYCKRGHEFTPENTYIKPSRRTRECLTCRRLYRQHKRGAHATEAIAR
jgi:hypothetical protein